MISVGMVNYVTAGIVGAIWWGAHASPVTWSSTATGATMGVCYFVAFFIVVHVVRWKGAANVTVVTRLSILIPLAFGILLWNERPDHWQWIGVSLACASLTLIGRGASSAEDDEIAPNTMIALAALFLIGGGARLTQESFRYLCQGNEQPTFLMVAFGLTAVCAIAVEARRRRLARPAEIVIGVLLGLTNLFQTFFILKALQHFEGYIVFPVCSAGSLVFTAAVAIFMLREKVSWQSCAGILLAAGALGLLRPI